MGLCTPAFCGQAYIDFIIQWVQSADFHGCAFINASAEYSAQSAPPHVLASQHKQQVLNYLQGICAHAGLTQPSAVAMQLFVIGEGLIVTSQVSGFAPAMLPAIHEMVAVLCGASPRE